MFFGYVQSEAPTLHVFNLHSGLILTAIGEKAVAEGVGKGWHFDTYELSPGNVPRLLFLGLSGYISAPCTPLGLASKVYEAAFLKAIYFGRNKDVEVLKANAKKIESDNVLITEPIVIF